MDSLQQVQRRKDASSDALTSSGRQADIVPLSRWFGVWVVRGPTLAGILAFAITGFVGLGGTLPAGYDKWYPFQRPVALTLFGVGLGMFLQWLMLSHPTPHLEHDGSYGPVTPTRSRVVKALIATTLALALIAILDVPIVRDQVRQLIQSVADAVASRSIVRLIALLLNTYFIGNYLWYLVEQWTPRLWKRDKRARGSAAASRKARQRRQTAILGVFGTDLLSGALILSALALVFSHWVFPQLVEFVARAFAFLGITITNAQVDACTLALNDCPTEPGHLPFTLSLLDLVSAFALAFLAAIILGLYLVERRIYEDRPTTAVERETRMGLRNMRRALLAVLEGMVRPVRRGLWPLLVFAGVLAITLAARSAQTGLGVLNLQHQAWWYGLTNGCDDVVIKKCYNATPFETDLDNWKYLVYSLVAALAAFLLFFTSVLVQLYETRRQARAVRQVSHYWSRALAQWARSIVIPIGLASAAFAFVTGILLIFQNVSWIDQKDQAGHLVYLPLSYFPPGALALFAAIVFGYDLTKGLVTRRRKRAAR